MFTKRSHVFKQSCSWKVCVSTYDLFVTTRHYRVNYECTFVSLKIYTLSFISLRPFASFWLIFYQLCKYRVFIVTLGIAAKLRFSAIFLFSQNDSPCKVMKNAFCVIWKAFFVLKIFNFLLFPLPLFFLLSAIARDKSRINLKIFDVIN